MEGIRRCGHSIFFSLGKVNNLDAAKVKKIYGTNVDKWIIARNRLLPAEMRPIFTNEFMEQMGLDKVVVVDA